MRKSKRASAYVENYESSPLAELPVELWAAVQELQEILYTGSGADRGTYSEYAELVRHIREGNIQAVSIKYRPSPELGPNEATWDYMQSRGGGSHHHSLLKWSALNFLRSVGSQEPAYERWCASGRCDVFCRDLGIIVECGCVSPAKVIAGASCTDVREFWVFPFRDSSGIGTAYRFRRNPDSLPFGPFARLNFPTEVQA